MTTTVLAATAGDSHVGIAFSSFSHGPQGRCTYSNTQCESPDNLALSTATPSAGRTTWRRKGALLRDAGAAPASSATAASTVCEPITCRIAPSVAT